MFGQPAAGGGLFGAAKPALGLFGAPATAPAAGGLFGAKPAGGLFGAAPAAAGGLFGAAKPALGGGLFGATPAPAAGGLFGAAKPAGGLFGQKPAFGAAAAAGQPQQQMSAAQQQAAAKAERQAAVDQAKMQAQQVLDQQIHTAAAQQVPYWYRDLLAAHAAYTEGQHCKFHDWVYEVLGDAPDLKMSGGSVTQVNTAKKARKADVLRRMPWINERKWQEMEELNPDPSNLIPTPLVGVEALHTRIAQQEQNVKWQLRQVGEIVNGAAPPLGGCPAPPRGGSWLDQSEEQSCKLNEAIERCREGQAELTQRLIRALGRLERLQCRVAVDGGQARQQREAVYGGYGAAGRGQQFQSRPLFDQERNFHAHLRELRDVLDDPNGPSAMLSELVAEQSMRLPPSGQQQPVLEDGRGGEGDEGVATILQFLDHQREGLEKLVGVVSKDIRDVKLIVEAIKNNY